MSALFDENQMPKAKTLLVSHVISSLPARGDLFIDEPIKRAFVFS